MIDIAHTRLLNQKIIATNLDAPKAVVAYMGAMQAQDYAMSKWAVGTRFPEATDALIEQALDRGEIVRTHVLRPTWHLVAAEDIRWMLALTAPHIRSAMGSMNKQLGLDAAIFSKSNRIIEKTLAGGRELTREAIMLALEQAGVAVDSHRAVHLMMYAELEAIVCNGSIKDKKQTYALLEERLPKGLTLTREEALATLAQRYFSSHAPATLHDFQWWSGLPMPDARKGLEAIKNNFIAEKVDGQTYWLHPDTTFTTTETVCFLSAFDEFMVSYKDRSASIEAHLKQHAITSNGIFKPIIVVNGKVTGVWKRTLKKDRVLIDPDFFDPNNRLSKETMLNATQKFGNFLGVPVEIA